MIKSLNFENSFSEKVQARRAKRDEILERAKDSCQKLGGMAEIGVGIVVVDTAKFEVRAK